MSVLTLQVDEVMRTLSNDGQYPFVENDKEVDIVRFAINSGFADIVLDGQVALRVMYQRPGETEVRAKTLTYYDTDGLHNYYDWQLSQSDLAKNGSLMVALCILDISGGEVSEWHTTPCAVRVLSTIHTDDSDEGDDTITPTIKERVAVLETMIQRVASGAPIVVASTSAMTDTSRIYVLTTDGKWYYHNGTAWTAGGAYGTVSTDRSLVLDGSPADAKATGDAIRELNSNKVPLPIGLDPQYGTTGQVLTALGNGRTKWKTVGEPEPSDVISAVNDWLDEHPEATTTVQDGSITTSKLAAWAVPFVYPEQFGAVGDGITDDAQAIQAAINYCIANQIALVFKPKTYGVIPYQENKTVVLDNGGIYALIINGKLTVDLNGATIKLLTNTVREYCVVTITDADGVIFKNGTIIGDRDTATVSNDNSQLLSLFDSRHCLIDNIHMQDSKGDCFGHSGVQIGQPNCSREFEDFYMGNVISNCVMSHSTRHGMTFSKGRGVTFRNCRIENVRPEGQISYNGFAVDMEPYYGRGSIYDISFVECSMTDNVNGALIYYGDNVNFEGCFLQGLAFKKAVNGFASNCVITGGLTSNSSSTWFDANQVDGEVVVHNHYDYYALYGEFPNVQITNNLVNNRIIVNFNRFHHLYGNIYIVGNTVNESAGNIPINMIGHDDAGEVKNIVIEGNRISKKRIASSVESLSVGINVLKVTKAIIRNNILVYDHTSMGQLTCAFSCEKVSDLVLDGNIVKRVEEQDATYIKGMRRVIYLKDITNPAIVQNNIINQEGMVLSTGNLNLIESAQNDDNPVRVVLTNNYAQGVNALANTYTNLLVDFGNIINNALVSGS